MAVAELNKTLHRYSTAQLRVIVLLAAAVYTHMAMECVWEVCTHAYTCTMCVCVTLLASFFLPSASLILYVC